MSNPKPPEGWRFADLEVHNGVVRLVLKDDETNMEVHVWRDVDGPTYTDTSDVFGFESDQELLEAVETYGYEVLQLLWEDLEKSIEQVVGAVKGSLIKSAQYQPIGDLGLKPRSEEEMDF
jgi:hypothetical protein